MMSALRWISLFAATGCMMIFLIMAWPYKVIAQTTMPECLTIEMDKSMVEATGQLQWLGVFPIPFTNILAVFYRNRATNMTEVSAVVDGCVAINSMQVAPYAGPPEPPPTPSPSRSLISASISSST